jgi:RNA-directed DNA polymerase
MLELGVSKKVAIGIAYSSKGPWRMAKAHGIHIALNNMVIEELGYIPMEKLVNVVKVL